MYIKPTAAIAILFILHTPILTANDLPRPASRQSDPAVENKPSTGENAPMSDREKVGLRGPVQQCTEERTTPAFENFPGTSYVTINKYSPEGRLLQFSAGNSVESAQESSTTYTYDSAGRLLKKTTTNSGSPVSESNYQYDQKGRIISITGDPLGTSTFEYDDNGRKTRILSSDRKLAPALGSTAISFSVLEQDDLYLPIPAGGQAKTLFNEHGQSVESQILDANGNLLNRLIHTYNENGRLTESRYTIENFLSSLPAEAQQQLMAEPGAAEEMEAQLTKLLGEQRNFTRTTYAYDTDGRLIEQHQYTGYAMEGTTKITYNDHSDKLEEHTFTTGDPNPPRDSQSGEPQSSAPPTQESRVRYSYTYDTFGNWTEQAISSFTSPNDASVTRRIIIYY